MPSDLPKVTAYISPETREALDAASSALGQSRSRLVGELLDAAVPVLRALTDAARTIANASEMQREAMRATAQEMAAVTGTGEALQAQVLDLMGRLSATAEGTGGEDPRPSNTGVRTP